jgi:hypothetical protein
MSAGTEIDATAVHAPGTDMTPYTAASAPEEYRARFVMEPSEAAALDEQLRNCMRAVLKPDVDYGLIPGMGNKPSLFKPGAEKLIQWFGFGFESNEVKTERDDPEYPSGIADKVRRVGVTYRCTVYKELADGRRVTVATCEAYAGYDEDKFYVSLEAARSKAEAKERQWAAKDKRQPNPAKWEYVSEYRAPWNSVMKMCEKRALVGAAIDATAAAGLFTQDLEDMRADAAAQEATAFADAARAAMMALPDEAREGLDRWYRGKRWPDPGQWTAGQWCAALQMAGYLTAAGEHGDGGGGGQPATDGAPQDAPATSNRNNGQGGQVSRPSRPQAAPEPGDPDGEAQEYADHAHEARTITDLMDIQRRARDAGKIGAVINSPVSGKPGKLAVYIDWKRKQLAEIDSAVSALNDAANAHGMSTAELEAHVSHVTGADFESATVAQLRAAAKALERAA